MLARLAHATGIPRFWPRHHRRQSRRSRLDRLGSHSGNQRSGHPRASAYRDHAGKVRRAAELIPKISQPDASSHGL
jgi:hypothetical protein